MAVGDRRRGARHRGLRSFGSPLLLAALVFGCAGPRWTCGFLASGGVSRRVAATLLAPGSALLGQISVAHAEDAVRISRPREGAPLFSFELPAGPDFQDNTKEIGNPPSVVLYSRKADGATITVGPAPEKDFVKKEKNSIAPGSGEVVVDYTETPEQDDIETVISGNPNPFMDGSTPMGRVAIRKWMRVIRGPKGAALMIIEIPQEKAAAEKATVQAVLQSFRLGA
mmetsp:Transcript_40226/g.87945  ORF Transcript_40226/g.87945 Transcript_40226/m.87945 type:complete len:226 (-) Transcript_40226:46-723(-)